MSENSFATARASAERTPGARPNDLNRAWWESLPMTYAPWEERERTPLAVADFRRVEAEFLRNNPGSVITSTSPPSTMRMSSR